MDYVHAVSTKVVRDITSTMEHVGILRWICGDGEHDTELHVR